MASEMCETELTHSSLSPKQTARASSKVSRLIACICDNLSLQTVIRKP